MNRFANLLPRVCLLVTLLVGSVLGAHSATITYSLKTHEVFGYSYTITESVSLSAGSDLLDNMPQKFWRAYTTYKFYSDEALTQEIAAAPADNATVYVDYDFNPLFIPSIEGEDPTWLFLRGYNESPETGYGNTYLLYKKHSKNEVDGYEYTSNGGLPKAGNNYPMEKSTHCYWAIYGDGFNCQIKLRDDANDNYWLIWAATSGSILQLKPRSSYNNVGWQLYVNKAKNSKFPSGGMMSMGVPGVANYVYELRNVNEATITSTLNTNQFYFNEKNELEGKKVGNYNYKTKLWWYALFATPTMSTTPVLYHVTYKVLKAYDYNAKRIEYSAQKTSTAFTYKEKYDTTKELPSCTYTFYKDAEMTVEYAEGETLPTTENTIIYVKESCPIEDHWTTFVSPINIANPDIYFGSKDDGRTPAVAVQEYTGVELEEVVTGVVNAHLIFKTATEIVAGKPYLINFDGAGSVMKEKYEAARDAATGPTCFAVDQTDASVSGVTVSMLGTYTDLPLAAHQSSDDPLNFYLGYLPASQTYKFYIVKKDNFSMPAYHCYFYMTGASSVNLSYIGVTNGIGEVIGGTATPMVSGVYNLNGQLVRNGDTTEGLPAGIYVVNGKKLVVK